MINSHNGTGLRRIQDDDVAWMFRRRNDPRIMRWCRQHAPLHWDRHINWVSWQAHDDTTDMFIVEDIKSKHKVGCAGLTSINMINRRAEFSLWIEPSEHGKGYGTSALCNLLDYGFCSLGLNRIWGESLAGNPAMRLFKAMDMDQEGKRRDFYFKDGVYHDAHLFSINRAKFDAFVETYHFDQKPGGDSENK